MVSSLAGREREHKRWRKKFLHHSTSSFLVPCSIFKTTPYQFPGQRPNGMLTRGTRARTTIAKKVPSSFNFLIPCSLFNIQNNFISVPRPEAYWYAHSRDASENTNDSDHKQWRSLWCAKDSSGILPILLGDIAKGLAYPTGEVRPNNNIYFNCFLHTQTTEMGWWVSLFYH